MKTVDYILMVLVAGAVGCALFFMGRNRKKGCGRNCGSCGGCGKQK